MFQTLDEAAAFIRHKGVAMVDLKFCDLWGRWRHVTLPATRFSPSLLESGVGFDGSSLAPAPRPPAARAEGFLKSSGGGESSLWGPEFEFYLFDGVSYENAMNVAAYRV